MSRMEKLLLFVLSGLHCALPLECVERILRSVEISPVPNAPEIITGLVNIHGRIVPVLNLRRMFLLPEIEISLDDQIIIAHTTNRPVAIFVDNVIGMMEYSEQDVLRSKELFPGIEYLEGVAKLKGDIIYIYNLDRLITPDDETGIGPLLSQDISLLENGEM